MTQEKILARLAAEPEEGMKLIMRLYTGLMCTVCRGILGSGASPQDVEDCVSAALCKVLVFPRKLRSAALRAFRLAVHYSQAPVH